MAIAKSNDNEHTLVDSMLRLSKLGAPVITNNNCY